MHARDAVLYVCCDRLSRPQLEAVIAQRAVRGIDRLPVRLATAPARFLAGQESALVSRLSGRAALPAFTPPPVFERGVDGRPTLVQNVETLAHLALIARYGPGWFRAAGTPAEPGTMLCTLHQADGSAAVAETQIGTALTALLDLGPAQAVLVGGYHGARSSRRAGRRYLPPSNAADCALPVPSPEPGCSPRFRRTGADWPRRRGSLATSALESAGQCGPCLNGLPRIAAALTEVGRAAATAAGAGPAEPLERPGGGRGACHHPDGTVTGLCAARCARLRRRSTVISEAAARRPAAARSRRRLPGLLAEADWSRLHDQTADGRQAVKSALTPSPCSGHGLCAELLPELITLDEWGYPVVADQRVPARLARQARRAVTDCPALALLLSEAP